MAIDTCILIVEDDEPTQNLLQAVLRRFGYSTELASNGAEAIGLLKQKAYAAVVLDLMMPAVSGRDVIDFLSAGVTPTPVVICSAAGPAALAGLDPNVVKAVVRKPFDIDELVETVKAATGG
ncbi:MAG TPA: response regulator [Thermoanaerobaculia bacterium]|nr:response regulator [Thermoanaerobaculia bacterium]